MDDLVPLTLIPLSKRPIVDHLLLVDILARDSGHLLRDDECMGEALAPLATRFSLLTSRSSIVRLPNGNGWSKYSFPDFRRLTSNLHIQYLLQTFMIRTRGAKDVIFQSFDELSVILFKITHLWSRIHLVVTSHLTPERFERSPVIARKVLGFVFRLATSILVHCRFEKELILKEFPWIDSSKIIIKPNHIMSFSRRITPCGDRDNMIAFFGPVMAYKSIHPVIRLIMADTGCKYRYNFYLMNTNDIPKSLQQYLETRPNVSISYGYLDDEEYYSIYEKASWVILTHDKSFEGRTSGILSDAIASGVPILSSPIAPQTEYFQDFGPLGILADFSSDEWIPSFLEFDLSQNYQTIEKAMTKARASGQVENITQAFYQALTAGKNI